jgi:ADP-heptose:LPS heptosyltransferase
MKNILIFKTDRLGDLLNISAVIYNLKLNYPECKITLVCSNYNKSIARYYENDLNIITYDKPLIVFLFKNYLNLNKNNFDLILQLDGKNHSYISSILLNATTKACIKYVKNKKFFNKLISVSRPNFLINNFFDKNEISYENYDLNDNHKYHYLSLYLNLLKNLNIKIFSKDHYLPFKNPVNQSNFNESYFLFHIDQRWEAFEQITQNLLNDKILSLSKNNKIVITSNLGNNKIFNFLKTKLENNNNVQIVESPDLNKILSLIYYSNTCVSSHSGLIVHAAAAFKKNIIDLVSPSINNELDRWIPFNINYKRFDINNFYNFDF